MSRKSDNTYANEIEKICQPYFRGKTVGLIIMKRRLRKFGRDLVCDLIHGGMTFEQIRKKYGFKP